MDMSDFVIPETAKKQVQIVTCVVEGILDEEDLRVLAGLGAPAGAQVATTTIEPDDPSDLKKLREKHHSVARMVAAGHTQRMVSLICRYTESYVSILLNSPAMQELVEMYRIQNGAAAQVITEKLKTVGGMALDKLLERMDTPESISTQELLAAAKLGMDRSGHGPSSTQHVVKEEHILDHAEITRLNNEARKGSRSSILSLEDARNASHTITPLASGDSAGNSLGSPAGHEDDRPGDEYSSTESSSS